MRKYKIGKHICRHSLLFLLVIFMASFGASKNVKYFEQKLYGKKKLKALIEKSQSFINISSKQVRSNSQKALELARAKHDTAYIALSYSYLGASYVMDKMYDTAFVLLTRAENFTQKTHDKGPLVSIYQDIKHNNNIRYVSHDYFNCESELFLVPLINENRFKGILGLILPKSQSARLIKEKHMETGDHLSDTNKAPNILIVDDEDDNIVLLKSLLKKYHCNIIAANSGLLALDSLKENSFDFVLMDLEMPEISGYETVNKIPEDIRKDMKLYAITAYTKNELCETDLQLFDDVISKPISRTIIVEKLSLTLKK